MRHAKSKDDMIGMMMDIASAAAIPGAAPSSVPQDRGWEWLGNEISNFDGILPSGLEAKLRAGGYFIHNHCSSTALAIS